MYGHDLNPVTVKQNVALAVIKRIIGSGGEEEEQPEAEPEQSRDQQLGDFYKDMGIEEDSHE